MSELFVEPGTLTGNRLVSVPVILPKIGAFTFCVLGDPVNPTMFLINESTTDLTFPDYMPIFGYGKVSWRFAKDAEDKKDLEIPYVLKTSDDIVLMDDKEAMTLKSVVEAQG